MNKPSTGLCISCPSCRQILFKDAAFKDTGSFRLRCSSCQELIQVDIKTVTKVETIPVKALAIILIIFLLSQLFIFYSISGRINKGIQDALNEYDIEKQN